MPDRSPSADGSLANVPPRAVGRVLAAAAVLFAVGLPALPAGAATPVAGGVYTLVSASSGKCVNVSGSATGNGALLAQVACVASAGAQQFRVVAQNGAYGLVNVNSGRCVDVPNYSTDTGVQLWQWTCGASGNQTWTLTPSAVADRFLLRSSHSGLCVGNKDGSTAGNNPIVQEPCSDIARMQWRFNPAAGTPTQPPGSTLTVAADGSGQYRTVQAAINAVPSGNSSRVLISVRPGTYREIVTMNKPNVTLRGDGSGPSATVIVNNRSAYTSGTSGSFTAQISGRDAVVSNLTISNDFDETSTPEGHQAVALRLDSDRAVLTDVRVLGDQDTFLLGDSARAYMKNSYVEGTVDFIFGGGTIVFDGCDIYEKRSTGGPITAASTAATKTYGFLFYRSRITGAGSGNTTLGRPWRPDAQVLYRESTLSPTIRTSQPWTDMSANSWRNARFLEYRNTGPGAGTNSNRPQLSDSQAANYTPQRYLAGTDGWNPL
ncbi:pectinesterase family protein [Nonomuraea harbinensis]|uniref:Pectinesterase n=1 Tax=Nonomuraea harbinensis TaxID=1286938 RepID=A0ABW1C324_9ACTN|nr:pectinesterase family protein [Nonomuraea harbinensis]